MDSPIVGFSHLQLNVANVEQSVAWYCDLLGMVVMAEHGDVVALRHPTAKFVIVVSQGESTQEHSPVDHLAFAVPNGELLNEWVVALRAKGFEIPDVVNELGKPSLQLRDPDGNAIELVAPTKRQ